MFLDSFCRICNKELSSGKFRVKNFIKELNLIYRNDDVNFLLDDQECQSQVFCRHCYKAVKKAKDDLQFLKKNPGSNKEFTYKVPAYQEHVTVHTEDCQCVQQLSDIEETPNPSADDIPPDATASGASPRVPSDNPSGALEEATPSKIRRMSGDPLESPSDTRTSRELRDKTPIRKSLKFGWKNERENLDEKMIKVYTSYNSIDKSRVSNNDVASFFFCRICGNLPQVAKVSAKCFHMFCGTCIDNYKTEIDSTKCPPVFSASAVENQFGGEECKVPSSKEDIIIVDGFLLDIHQSLKISCRNEHCDKEVPLKQLEDHEKGCKKRRNYKSPKSIAKTSSQPLKRDADQAINLVVDWCQKHQVAPCDFLFFSLQRLIRKEAPELEESVQHVFEQYMKQEKVEEKLSPVEALALTIGIDLSSNQYRKLKRNKVLGSKLPSELQLRKVKAQLDPGCVNYKIYSKSDKELLSVHDADINGGIIEVEADIGNISYGDLNINIQGCRATLHDTIAKLFEEKYPEIETDILHHPDCSSILADANRIMKLFVKVCFDGTSAPVRSSRGSDRLPVNNWLRGTIGLVGVEVTYKKPIEEMKAVEVVQRMHELPDTLKKMTLRDLVNKKK